MAAAQTPRSLGTVVLSGRACQMAKCVLAHVGLVYFRRWLCGRSAFRGGCHARDRRPGALGAGRRVAIVRLHWRNCWRNRILTWLLARRLAPIGLAGGLYACAERKRRRACARTPDIWHPP